MKKKNKELIDFIVYIGRFSLCHDGHIHTVKKALEQGKRLIILIGSADEPRNMRNPWTYEERKTMLELAIDDNISHVDWNLIFIAEHHNFINMLPWELQIQEKVKSITDSCNILNPTIRLIGYKKDPTSNYLNSFPQWNPMITVDHYNVLNASDMRDEYFRKGAIDHVSARVANYLSGWILSAGYGYVSGEYEFQDSHDSQWKTAPYTPTFNYVDSIVIQSGHILLIRRRNHPGKGCWAIPGGYVNAQETTVDSMIRELREETKLKVPSKVLMGSIKHDRVYDNPTRSTRGRLFTRAYLIHLNDDPNGLPKVRGDDDADKAQWIPLYQFMKMRSVMFEDHYLVVRDMLGI